MVPTRLKYAVIQTILNIGVICLIIDPYLFYPHFLRSLKVFYARMYQHLINDKNICFIY